MLRFAASCKYTAEKLRFPVSFYHTPNLSSTITGLLMTKQNPVQYITGPGLNDFFLNLSIV